MEKQQKNYKGMYNDLLIKFEVVHEEKKRLEITMYEILAKIKDIDIILK